MKKLVVVFLLIVFAACSSLKVSSDYDSQTDFTKYKTYTFSEDVAKLPVQPLNRDRIIKAVENEMAAKGFTKSESNPDMLVDLNVKAVQRTEATATNTGGMYGGGFRYGYGGGYSTTQISYNEYVDGTLFVNMVDNASQKIVWQGRATKTLDEDASAEKREKNINYAIKTIFTKYPPLKKK